MEFGEALIKFLNKFLERTALDSEWLSETVICPIPLFSEKQKIRGFNQSELIAAKICLEGPRLNLLERIAYQKAQMTLNEEERLKNVKGVFRFSGTAAPRKVILIDDVATTLATLEEAAVTLKAAGVEKVYALVLARENFEIERKRL